MKFTVTIPAYKCKYLSLAIESILHQTYTDFELIIVDDCSPEDIKNIVDNFSDSRIRYYRNDVNCGAINVVDNWNKCLEYAKGDFIICMGDDDKLLPNCLEEYSRLIEKYPGLNVYHGFTEIIDEESVVFDLQQQRPEWESSLSLLWHRWNYRTRQFIGDFCYSVKHLKDVGGYFKLPLAWASDDISAVRAALHAGIANTQVPVFQYRVNRFSISKSANDKYKMEAIKQEREWYAEIFMKDDATVKDELDIIYLTILRRQFDKHWQTKYLDYLSQDMMKKHSHVFMWIRRHDYYGYSISTVLRAFKRAIK